MRYQSYKRRELKKKKNQETKPKNQSFNTDSTPNG